MEAIHALIMILFNPRSFSPVPLMITSLPVAPFTNMV